MFALFCIIRQVIRLNHPLRIEYNTALETHKNRKFVLIFSLTSNIIDLHMHKHTHTHIYSFPLQSRATTALKPVSYNRK